MKYGELETTGNVERRGARHALHLECVCVCGKKKFVRKDALEQGKVVSCGETHGNWYAIPKHFYVKVADSTERFAVGEPEDDVTFGSLWNAKPMTRQEAESWKIRRIAHRASKGYPKSIYKIVEL